MLTFSIKSGTKGQGEGVESSRQIFRGEGGVKVKVSPYLSFIIKPPLRITIEPY